MEDDEVCVLPGETLERLLGKKIKGNLHRVVSGEGSRLNLTFELRPLLPIYHEWGSVEEQKSRKDSTASKSSGNVSNSEVGDVY
jgi:isopenicillin N synthase-like dioxygenase